MATKTKAIQKAPRLADARTADETYQARRARIAELATSIGKKLDRHAAQAVRAPA